MAVIWKLTEYLFDYILNVWNMDVIFYQHTWTFYVVQFMAHAFSLELLNVILQSNAHQQTGQAPRSRFNSSWLHLFYKC